MASLCRSALMAGTRSIAARSKLASPNSLHSKPVSSLFSSPSSCATIPRPSRVISALGCVDSLMPLHNAIASSRLISNIAVDSTCWSFLSQDVAVPR